MMRENRLSPKARASYALASWTLALLMGSLGLARFHYAAERNLERDQLLALTEHQLAEKIREEAIAKDQETLDFIRSLPYPVAMLNDRGEVTLWNPAAEREFGWTEAELKANGIDSIIPEEMRQRHHTAFGAAMHGSGKVGSSARPKLQSVDCFVLHKDKSRASIPVQVNVRVGKSPDGEMYAMANIDRQSKIVRVDAAEVKP